MLKKLLTIGLLSGLFVLPSIAQQPYYPNNQQNNSYSPNQQANSYSPNQSVNSSNPNQSANSYNQSWISVGLRGSNKLNQNVFVRLGSNSSPVLTARTPLHYLGVFRVRPGQPVSISANAGGGFRVLCGSIPANARKVTINAYKQGSIYRCGMQIN